MLRYSYAKFRTFLAPPGIYTVSQKTVKIAFVITSSNFHQL